MPFDYLLAAAEVLSGSRSRAAAGLGLFALSPVPAAQLFVAAGLMTVLLVPLKAAFFSGRLVSYSIYVAGASAVTDTFGSVVLDSLRSPLGMPSKRRCSSPFWRSCGRLGGAPGAPATHECGTIREKDQDEELGQGPFTQ